MNAETVVTKTAFAQSSEFQRVPALFDRTVHAFAWRVIAEWSRFVLQLAVMIVLARLLPVESFGLLTIAMIFINFALKAQLGVSAAIVQANEITSTYVRVAFSLSVLSGSILTVLIWSGAPSAAALFGAGAITGLLRLMSISFLFSSFGAVAEALLERKLDYRSLLRVELLSYGIGYCLVGITLALLDYGVWALAWATVSYALLKTSFLISASPHAWWPSFARAECSRLLNFSTGTTLSRLANFAAANADYFVVGRWLGATALGLYSRAFQLMSLPMYEFSSVISGVLFPAYARIQNDTERLKRAYLGAICLSFLVIMPALTILAVTAPDLIAVCFGPAWTGAALPLQILCIGGVFQCMYNLADSLARAKGAVYWKLSCHTVYAGCVFVASLIGSRWGITGVAAGVVIAMSVIYVLMARLSLYLTRASWTEFFLSQLPGSIVAATVAFVAIPTSVILRSTRLPHLLILAVTSILALASAFAIGVLLPRVWLDQISHGAIEKARRWWRQISISGKPVASLRLNSNAFVPRVKDLC